jgi:hypothetical protein
VTLDWRFRLRCFSSSSQDKKALNVANRGFLNGSTNQGSTEEFSMGYGLIKAKASSTAVIAVTVGLLGLTLIVGFGLWMMRPSNMIRGLLPL